MSENETQHETAPETAPKIELQLATVEYRRLETTHNYSNVTVGATAYVLPGQDPQDVYDALKQRIDGEINELVGYSQLRVVLQDEIDTLRRTKNLAERETETVLDELVNIREIIRIHSGKMPYLSSTLQSALTRLMERREAEEKREADNDEDPFMDE